jgi:hypothetical protein
LWIASKNWQMKKRAIRGPTRLQSLNREVFLASAVAITLMLDWPKQELMRLKRMLSHLSDDEIRQATMRCLLVEWVAVPSWSHRCLLERYGSVACTPLFDIDAEH